MSHKWRIPFLVSMFFLGGLLFLGFFSPDSRADFYKCKLQDGSTVLNDTLSNECINQGYQIINSKGMIIKTVDRQKTIEEVKAEEAQKIEKEQAQAKEKELQAQKDKQAFAEKEKDDVLLQTFDSVKDINDSKNAKILAINSQIKFTQNNSEKLKKKIEDLIKNKESYTQKKQAVPEVLDKNLKDLEQQLKNNDEYMAQQKKQVQNITKDYQGYVERFVSIKKSADKSKSQKSQSIDNQKTVLPLKQ